VPSAGGNSSSGGSKNSDSERPNSPVLISPLNAISTEAPAIVARAEATASILVLNDGVKIAEAAGNGDQDVTISLSHLTAGIYDKLTIVTERRSLRSSTVPVPVITVTAVNPAPEGPVLVSPTSSLVTNYPVIVAKAAANAKIIVLNDGNAIKEAAGQGTSDVRIPLGYLTDGTYSKLTLVTEVNGQRSAPVTVPEIKVDSSMAITVKADAYQPGTGKANLKLYMNNFVDANMLYAAEAHLVYSNLLYYAGSNEISGGSDTVFGAQTQSAETLKEHSGNPESELIYAASNYESVAGSSSNFQVSGEQLLVTVPLNISTSVPSNVTTVPVKLVYYKVVNKDGNTVAEFNGITNPKVINVPVK
jgi:hypothetical protein